MGKDSEAGRGQRKTVARIEGMEQLNAADADDLIVDAGATTILAPDSTATRWAYRQVRPQSIDEVRAVLGPGDHEHDGRDCCSGDLTAELGARHVSLDDLESEDPAVREDARRLAYLAGRAYVRGLSPVAAARWRPVIDRYMELTKALISVAVVGDMDVYDRGTLVVSAAIQAVYARKVRLHGTGQINCKGPTTFRAESVEGYIGRFLGTLQQADLINRIQR